MKNKSLILTFILLFGLTSVQAASDRIHVSSLEDFSTASPSKTLDVIVKEEGNIGEYLLKPDDVIHCNVVKTTSPKRGKRAAGFVVQPISYTTEGQTNSIYESYYGKYASKVISKEELKNIDKVKVGKKAAMTVGGHFVKGLAPAVTLAEGMIKNEEGNRIESGVKNVYKSSPLSYVEKGQEINLTPEQPFYLIFKPANVQALEYDSVDE